MKTFGGSKDSWLRGNLICFTVCQVYLFVGMVLDQLSVDEPSAWPIILDQSNRPLTNHPYTVVDI